MWQREISKIEKIVPEQLDIDMMISGMAHEAGQPIEEFKKRMSPHTKEIIDEYLARMKALEFLVKNAKIK